MTNMIYRYEYVVFTVRKSVQVDKQKCLPASSHSLNHLFTVN